jgi:hypothetical protein
MSPPSRQGRVRRGRRGCQLIATVLAGAVLLGGCGSFDSKASGQHLIRDYVTKFGKGQLTLTSVDCPSGVAQKTGASYDCKVVLRNVHTGQRASGTITIHMVSGNKVEIGGAQDIHVG